MKTTRCLRRTFAWLLICGTLLCAGCGYQNGLDEGYRSGYEAGKKAGLGEGKTSGLAEGRENGYAEGRRMGLVVGYGNGSVAFVEGHWLPSLGLAVVSAGALFVLFACGYLFATLVFPSLARMVASVRANRSRRDERRERRRYLARLQAEKVIRVKLLSAQLAEKAQAAIQDEETLTRFEQALQTMRETVSEEHWLQLKSLGARWAEVAAAIDGHRQLAPADKELFRREMIAAYQHSTATPPPTT